jgi:hypothetical protein
MCHFEYASLPACAFYAELGINGTPAQHNNLLDTLLKNEVSIKGA